MKRIPRRCRALLLCLAAVMLLGILSGCQSGTDPALRLDKGTSADFARMAADDVTLRRDTPDLLYNAGNLYIDLNQEPVFQPYFAILEFNAVQDEDDPELVHYSCMIPGAVGAVNNAVFNTCFVMNVTYSPFIKLEGTLRVVRDAEGRRCIDVSDADAPNAFTLYAALRYPNPPFFSYNGVDLSGGVTDANRADVMNILLNNASRLYAGAFGQEREAYVNQVVIPQLQSYSSNFQKNISPFRNDWGYGAGNAMTTPVAKIIFWVAIAIAALVAFYFLRKLFRKAKASADWNSKKGRVLQQVAPGITAARRRELAQRCSRFRYDRIVEGNSADVSRLSWPADREMLTWLVRNGTKYCRDSAASLLPFPDTRDLLLEAAGKGSVQAVKKLPYPGERDSLIRIARDESAEAKVRTAAADKLAFPEDGEALRALAESPVPRVALAALEKLPASESRERLLRYFRNAKDEERLEVLVRLPYTEETAGDLRRTALEGKNESLREKALEKLPYPLERETLLTAAEKDPDSGCRMAALKKLPVQQETGAWERAALEETEENRGKAVDAVAGFASAETLCKILTKDSDPDNRRRVLEYMEWSGGAAALEQAVLKDSDEGVRGEALKKLPFPEAKKILESVVLKDESIELREEALKRFSYPGGRKILAEVALNDPDGEIRRIARGRLPWLKEPEVWGSFVSEPMKGQKTRYTHPTDDDRLKAAIGLTFHPFRTDAILENLCRWTEAGRIREGDKDALNLAGWSAAALGRILAGAMKPEQIAANQKAMAKAIRDHNADAEKARALQKELAPYEGRRISSLPSNEREKAERLISQLNGIAERINRGLGVYMLDNKDLPFAYLTFLLRDNQSRVPRFIRQGVIMGLVNWLTENAEHPEAEKILKDVIAIRADLIRSDNDLSFFEVRVPSDCSSGDYAEVLAEVLHCANPSVAFCDTKKLLQIAEKEVPGCMEMLRVCPLRLIDPVNRQALGFYQFKPYIHAMWVQFQPPKDTGKVISRSHEVDDRTKPLSSGLNLKLFLDPYAVIPTLFHEYQHFTGDPNEASVFLKTQVFSIRFYKAYRKANAAADNVFTQMTAMLGMPPAAGKVGELNATIKKYYGEQVETAVAETMAEKELLQLNQYIQLANRMERWDPQVKFPLLDEDGDKKNADLIREIIIRFATVPKSISGAEFSEILRNAG